MSALLGLSVLAVVAFLVGAFAGLVWKEPGLVVAYLRGDTTEIAWSTASSEVIAAASPAAAQAAPHQEPPAQPAEPSAKQAAPARSRASVPAPPTLAAAKPAAPTPPAAKQPAAAPAPPAVASAPPGGRISVQVGAFAARDAAESLRVRLEDAGFPAYLAAGTRSGDPWRVRVGPFPSREEAGRVAQRLEQRQKLPTWVLDEDAE